MTIFLDEQKLGRDMKNLVIRNVILCGGLVGKTENGWLIGAHFDPFASANCIAAGLNYIRDNWLVGTRLNRAFFFYLESAWTSVRADNLSSAVGLKTHLKTHIGMDNNSELQLYDKGMLSKTGGIDFQVTNGGDSLVLDWRTYQRVGPNNAAPTQNVMQVHPTTLQISAGGHMTSPPGSGPWAHLAAWSD